MIILFSCTSKNQYRRKIDRLDTGDDKYLVAAAIGEYAHLFPGDIEQLPAYAEILLRYGYFTECIGLCNQILERDRKNRQVFYTRAIAFSDIWAFGKSIRDFDTLFALATPGEEIIEQYRSTVLYSNIYRKILSLDSLIAVNPGEGGYYLDRANLYLNMNEPLAATADYQFCLDLEGYDEDVIYNKLRAELLVKDYKQAGKDIEVIRTEASSAGKLDPDFLAGMVDEAEKYEGMIKQRPDDITGYIEMARIFTFLKIESKAVEYLRSAQKLQPGNDQIKYRMAVVYAMTGEICRARQLVLELEDSGNKIPDQLKEILNQTDSSTLLFHP